MTSMALGAMRRRFRSASRSRSQISAIWAAARKIDGTRDTKSSVSVDRPCMSAVAILRSSSMSGSRGERSQRYWTNIVAVAPAIRNRTKGYQIVTDVTTHTIGVTGELPDQFPVRDLPYTNTPVLAGTGRLAEAVTHQQVMTIRCECAYQEDLEDGSLSIKDQTVFGPPALGVPQVRRVLLRGA